MEPANRNPVKIYDLVSQDKAYFPFIDNEYIDENNRDSSHYKFSPSIGLGILDILEYYPNLEDKY